MNIANSRMLNVTMLLAVLFYSGPVSAQQPGSPAHANHYEYLIGTDSEGSLDIPGWNDEGGGSLGGSVWNALYEQDGAHLVLIEWALPRKPGATNMPFRVTDVLLIPPIEMGLRVVDECNPLRTNVFEKVFAVVRVDSGTRPDRLRDVRKAWKVDLDSGTISPTSTKGITCSIPSD